MKVAGLLIGFSLTISLSAQVVSPLDRFSIPFGSGCTPFTVTASSRVEEDVPIGYIFEEGLTSTNDSVYTYQFPGSYEIVQLVGGNILPASDTLPIVVYDPVFPEIVYSFCNSSTVFLDVVDSVYDRYRIQTINETILLETVDNLSAQLTFNPGDSRMITVEGLYNGAQENCGVAQVEIETNDLINDVFISNFEFEYVCDDVFNLTLEYQRNVNVTQQVQFSENGTDFITLFEGRLDSASQIFSGIQLSPAASQLCFRVNAISPCDGSRITGQIFCEPFIPNSGALEQAYATYVDDGIQLRWDQNPFGTYLAEKIVDLEVIDTFSPVSAGFTDRSISPLRSYSYNIIFGPDCAADQQRVSVSPPKINATRVSENRYEINWTPPDAELMGGFTFQLVMASSDSSMTIAVNDPQNPEIINLERSNGINQDIFLLASHGSGINIISNTERVAYEWVVYVPRAFTPNNDGINDVLEVFGLPTANFTMKIFNRWGQVVFVTSDTNSFWDGRLKSGGVREGSYLYEIEFLNEEGQLFRQQGNFVVIKK